MDGKKLAFKKKIQKICQIFVNNELYEIYKLLRRNWR